jgi:hypothetical protein
MIFTTDQLDAMKAAQTSHMNDEVDITNRVPYYSNGETLYSGVVQSGVACGFDFTDGVEIDKGQITIVDYDADMRLSLATVIDINDIVELTSLAGVTHSGEIFEVFEYPRYGTTVKHIRLRKRGH